MLSQIRRGEKREEGAEVRHSRIPASRKR